MSEWTADRTVTVPAGVYYLCDPCHVVKDEEWDPVLGASNFLNRVYAEHNRGVICAFETACGDGTFFDQFGNSYDVDAGLIGLTDVRYNPEFIGSGEYRIVTFNAPVECSSREAGHILTFDDTVIETF